jgi:hypothetical protein
MTMRLVMVVVAVASSAAGQVMPADDCGSVWMAGINELPFVAAGTQAWTTDVNFLVDLGSVCLAGAGGTPAAQDGDMVFYISLGEHHDVSCSFTSPEPFNTTDWTFVLSTSCAEPLAVNEFVGSACRWGQVVPQMTSAGFNTADLGLEPGTYYLWLAAAACCPYWEIQCTGVLVGLVFEDGFESADTTHWSTTIPSP